MEIMNQVTNAYAALRTVEKEMDNYIKDAILNSPDDNWDDDMLITPHYTSDRLMITIHKIGEDLEPVKMSIREIDFDIQCNIPVADVRRMAELIFGADLLLANLS
jgi:hypothetical protein